MTVFLGAYITGLFDHNNSCISGATATAMGASKMTDYVFWSIHVDTDGNLHYNNVDLVMNGTVSTANAKCLKDVADAGTSGGHLKRIWLSIGAGGTSDFTNIDAILNEGGAKKKNLLANFKAIVKYLDIYGFDYDNEDQIGNVDVIVNLTNALYTQNNKYRFSFCPYGSSQPPFNSADYWVQCLQGIHTKLKVQPVVGFNLQCYSGGANSDPKGWVKKVENAGSSTTGITDANALIRPGLAVEGSTSYPAYTPGQMTDRLRQWNSQGGWIWNTANVLNHNGGNPSIAQYASAILSGT